MWFSDVGKLGVLLLMNSWVYYVVLKNGIIIYWKKNLNICKFY